MEKYDISALPLPAPLEGGLARMIGRQLGLSGDGAGDQVFAALFGAPVPSFGQVRRLTASDIATAAERVGFTPTPVAVRELAELFAQLSPETTVCNMCSEMALSNTGGVIFALADGSRCPFCDTGIVHSVTMRLQMLAWTTGRLVPPQMEYDLHVAPGERIPLQDDGIVQWIDYPVDRELERLLKARGVPLYAVLAYAMLEGHLLPSFTQGADEVRQVARHLLALPSNLHFVGPPGLRALIRGASITLASREPYNVSAAEILRRRREQVVTADNLTFALEGRVGQGDSCDVFLGTRIGPFRESVVVKVLRALDDEDLLKREARALERLARSDAQGAHFFTGLLPRIVAEGSVLDGDGLVHPALILRGRNGYDWTLADVMAEYPEGVEPKTAVWMWNRLLTLIAWLQKNHIAHSAVIPEHVLINPVSHGAMLVDYKYATPFGEVTPAVVEAGEAYYPSDIFDDAPVTVMTDIEMSARCIIAVLGGDPRTGDLPKSLPESIAHLLYDNAGYDGSVQFGDDALSLQEKWQAAARDAFGPRKYQPFKMPRG